MSSVSETINLRCPNCGRDDKLQVTFIGTRSVLPHGRLEKVEGFEARWDADAPMCCTGCGHNGKSSDFNIAAAAATLPATIIRKSYKCPECGSHNISWNAHAEWNNDAQNFVASAVIHDEMSICNDCGEDIRPTEIDVDINGEELAAQNETAEWVGQHYRVNYDAEPLEKQTEWRRRYAATCNESDSPTVKTLAPTRIGESIVRSLNLLDDTGSKIQHFIDDSDEANLRLVLDDNIYGGEFWITITAKQPAPEKPASLF